MTSNENWRRYLDAGAAVGQITLARAEEIAKGLLGPGKEEREHARRDLDDLGRTGRQIGGQLIDLARRELAKQAKTIGSFDDLVDRLAQVVGPPRRPGEPAPTTGAEQPASNPDPVRPDGEVGAEAPKKNKPKKDKKDKVDRRVPTTSAWESRSGSKKDKIAERAKKKKKDKKKQKRTEHSVGEQDTGRVLSMAKPLDPQGRL